jgi:uncharacterized protein
MRIDEIKNSISEKKELLRSKYKIDDIGIFGSYARGEERNNSDVDILVNFSEPIGLLKLINMENYLSELLGAKADVVIKSDLRDELRDQIIKETMFV